MTLPDAFVFSQHSLSDFQDCPRRFYLKHIRRQAWPLLETGPGGMDALAYQSYLRKGSTLHQWIERHWSGISNRPTDDDAELTRWWRLFEQQDFSALPPRRTAELALVAPLGEFRLYVRFDLLCASDRPDGPMVVIDWKTLRAERRPGEAFMRARLQTRAYLYALATAGGPFGDGTAPSPNRCVMRYWLANFPEDPWIDIHYSAADYENDQRALLQLARNAATLDGEAAFEKTDDERKCTYCTYRTLCHRRGAAGGHTPDEDAVAVDLTDLGGLDY
jgi:PD-(D/E)XK nuclease superfamily